MIFILPENVHTLLSVAVLMQKLAEQKSDFEAYRDKLIAGYQQDKLALEKVSLGWFFFPKRKENN